jgi:4-hydroxybenzoyl-CoA reductase subunit alpha
VTRLPPPASRLPRQRTRVVGRPYAKVDAAAKVTGQTKFADDLFLPRMLHCKLLRSKLAHARILRVDISKALAMPGVLAVATGRDLPIPFGILPVSQDEHALAPDKVRYVGDPVAAVAAVDEDTAFDALDAIEVEYEPLSPIGSIEDAVNLPEPRIHDYGDGGNFHKLVAMEFGQVEKGFAQADRIYEDLFFYEGNTHLPIEQHAAVADFGPDGKLTVWSATQTPHYVHRALAKVLEMPAARIRVMKVKTGVKNDGSITAMHFQTALDGGGYGSYGVASTYYTGALQTVTYKVPAYRFDGARVFTNKPPCGPKRGHGTPQPRWALEVQLDKIACDLRLDPAAMRREHLQPANSLTANFLRIGSMGLGSCIDKVIGASGWKKRRGKLPEGRGLGMACSSYICGAGLPIYWNAMPQSGVQLKLDRSGGVTIFCGSTEIGQGSDSILAYIVAEVLGIDPFDIRVVTGDTDLTPVDLGSYSSRVTLMTGNAALQAAERARELLVEVAAAKLSIPGVRVAFADGRVFDVEDPEKGMPFADAVVAAESKFGTLGTVGSYTPPSSPGLYRGAGVGPSPAYSYSAAVAEVEIDPETGIYRVPKIWIAHDVGKCINPALVVGQVEGSIYMGLGEVMMEEMAYRDDVPGNLVHKFPSLLEYKSPTTLEMCEVETFLIEDPDPNGPFGAKEVGQGPLLPVPPAVANAIFDAIGVRIDEVPATPEKIRHALRSKAQGKPARYGPTKFPQIPYPEPIHVPTPEEGGDGRAVDAVATGAGGVR